jgi:hypothetical protein
MRIREVTYFFAIAFLAAIAIVNSSAVPPLQAQTGSAAAKGKMSVPPGGCAIAGGAIENGKTCAGPVNQIQWTQVMWCVNGDLVPTLAACWEPSGLCEPKC